MTKQTSPDSTLQQSATERLVIRFEAQVSEVKGMIIEGFKELKGLIAGLDDRVRSLEVSNAKNEGAQQTEISAIKGDLSDLKKQVKEQGDCMDIQDKRISKVEAPAKVGVWLLATIAVLVIALLFQIFTHQIVISFPP